MNYDDFLCVFKLRLIRIEDRVSGMCGIDNGVRNEWVIRELSRDCFEGAKPPRKEREPKLREKH